MQTRQLLAAVRAAWPHHPGSPTGNAARADHTTPDNPRPRRRPIRDDREQRNTFDPIRSIVGVAGGINAFHGP